MPHYGHRLCNLLRPVVAVSPDTKGPDHQFCNLSFLATNNNNRDYSYVPSMGQALARSSPYPKPSLRRLAEQGPASQRSEVIWESQSSARAEQDLCQDCEG